MAELPSGTVTFLFTDVEGSTRLWQEHPEAMKPALARHDAILRDVIATHHGHVVKTTGDGAHASFATVSDAIDAAVAGQLALSAEQWTLPEPLQVRMGIHTGPAELRDGDYYGTAVNRAARIMSVAHGGQVVCSEAAADLARDSLADGVTLVDLGEHRLRDLSRTERMFQVCAPGLVRAFSPLRTREATPGNLPRQVTTFVGREAEVEEVAALVAARPLVTLTGVGGVGKTRLALEVASASAGEFVDGAWLCELGPVTDPDAVWEALASAFRVVPPPGRRLEEVLLEYLAPKRLLVVLDNCEHLLDAVVGLVNVVGRECRDVALLATSREGLALPGERIVAVPSLPLPTPGSTGAAIGSVPSVLLFCERARDVKHDFAPTPSTLESVAQLCRRLDGIPLAIELAAARVGSLSPEDLLVRLDQRFRLLTRGSRASLERHQTLRNTIDWSYDLLDDTERLALQRLSVFAGGGDLSALEVVLTAGVGLDREEVVDAVSRLVDKSLVVAEPDTDGHLRYRMLETIRQYAQERLEASGDVSAVRSAHADHYVGFAGSAGPRLRSAELPQWAWRVERETDNFRTVVDWAVDTTQPNLALRLVTVLRGHGHATGYSATEWADTAVEIPGAEDLPDYLAVASWATFGATMRQDFPRATELAARIARIQDLHGRADPAAYQGLGTLAFFQGDLEGSHRLAEEWVVAARNAGDGYELSHALVLQAATEQALGEPLAREHMEEAVRVARDTGTLSALSLALGQVVSMFDIDDEDSDRALALSDEAIAVASTLDDPIAMFAGTGTRAMLLAARGEQQEALALAKRSVEAMRLANAPAAGTPAFIAAAVALTGQGHYPPAAILFGAARSLGGGPLAPWFGRHLHDAEMTLRTELGTEFQTLYDQGAALTSTDAIAYLIDEVDRG